MKGSRIHFQSLQPRQRHTQSVSLFWRNTRSVRDSEEKGRRAARDCIYAPLVATNPPWAASFRISLSRVTPSSTHASCASIFSFQRPAEHSIQSGGFFFAFSVQYFLDGHEIFNKSPQHSAIQYQALDLGLAAEAHTMSQSH